MNKLIKGKICKYGFPYDTGPCVDYPPGHPSLNFHIENLNGTQSSRLEEGIELYCESKSGWSLRNRWDLNTRLEVSKLLNKFKPRLSDSKIEEWIHKMYEKHSFKKATIIIRKWFPGFYPSVYNLP